MIAVIFTHPPDYPVAKLATGRLAALGMPVVWAIDHNDTPPPTARWTTTVTPRKGNLNGHAWLREQLETLYKLSQGYKWVAKVDSDLLTFALEWFEARCEDCDAVGFSADVRDFFGCCYALRREVIPRLLECLDDCDDSLHHGEDLATFGLLERVGARIHRYPSSERVLGFWTKPEHESRLLDQQIVCVQRPAIGIAGKEREPVLTAMRRIIRMREVSHD